MTVYMSKKRLINLLGDLSFLEYGSALKVLNNYPECKYYIYDFFNERFKPSKRGLKGQGEKKQ